MTTQSKKMGIRPTTSVYGTYRRLSYKPWFAIAEFVDNSTQSYFANLSKLQNHFTNNNSKFRVEINFDSTENKLSIYDNAYGMELEEFGRAIKLDSPPEDTSGRSEFGMGLKTAACWFGDVWSVETTQLNSNKKYIASIDVNELANTQEEEIDYIEQEVEADTHFTKITINEVQHPIMGRSVSKVKEHLTSIYRQDIRQGHVTIMWNGVPLEFDDPDFYNETTDEGNVKEWKKDVSFEVPWNRKNTSLKVFGWVGIRKVGKQKDAGFSLLRRGRVIVGGPNQGYKPTEVFGQANSFRSQRLVGELHMDDWPVTQAKDSFDWSDGLEDEFIDQLVNHCKEYADKAEHIRANKEKNTKPISKIDMENAGKNTKKVLENDDFSKWIQKQLEKENESNNNDYPQDVVRERIEYTTEDEVEDKKFSIEKGPIKYTFKLSRETWDLNIYWNDMEDSRYWMSLDYPEENVINIHMDLAHPFFSEYVNDSGILELIQRLVISMALAEKMAVNTSTYIDKSIQPHDLRIYMNDILNKFTEIKKVEI